MVYIASPPPLANRPLLKLLLLVSAHLSTAGISISLTLIIKFLVALFICFIFLLVPLNFLPFVILVSS
ncbi:hypothetical protein LINGRAHAP2_LOCUS11323, partial [Linum grandiflorum]